MGKILLFDEDRTRASILAYQLNKSKQTVVYNSTGLIHCVKQRYKVDISELKKREKLIFLLYMRKHESLSFIRETFPTVDTIVYSGGFSIEFDIVKNDPILFYVRAEFSTG